MPPASEQRLVRIAKLLFAKQENLWPILKASPGLSAVSLFAQSLLVPQPRGDLDREVAKGRQFGETKTRYLLKRDIVNSLVP